MISSLRVVMYHYIRDLDRSRYRLSALSETAFRTQLEYLKKSRTFVSVEDCLKCLIDGKALADGACLLTFDDGYLEHFTTVFPLLEASGIRAAFFPCGSAIFQRKLLDIHKIHLILALGRPSEILLTELLERVRTDCGEEKWEEAAQERAGRYDTQGVNLFKRLLQRELPKELRSKYLDHFWQSEVGVAEKVIAAEWYMTSEQLKCLHRQGHTVGCHGWEHPWYDALERSELAREFSLGLEFLAELGVLKDPWVVAYPFGSFTPETLNLVREMGGALGFTTKPEDALLGDSYALTLGRWDTNDVLTMS